MKCDGEDNCGDNSDEGIVCKGTYLKYIILQNIKLDLSFLL